MRRKTGLYFGSFNPIHTGHLIVAQSILDHTDFDEIWFVVSPQNPLKPNMYLAEEEYRLQMVSLAIHDNDCFKLCDTEFFLPKPSYTIHTLRYLEETYRKHEFGIIIGADNLSSFTLWKSYEEILKNYQLYVYPRYGFPAVKDFENTVIKCGDFPFLDISSTYIRHQIQFQKSIRYLVPDAVRKFIEEKKLYSCLK